MKTGVPTVRREPRGRLLPLRRFRARLDRALAASIGQSRPLVAAIAVDRLDVVTDGLGRMAGVEVLQEIARRITDAVSEGTLATRLGGTRFAVALPATSERSQLDDIEALRRVLDAPFELEQCDVATSVSVGIARYPADGQDADALLDSAERAVTRLKQSGGNGVLAHEPEMQASAIDRLKLEAALRTALERDELWVAYQPRVDVLTGEIHGVEALVRWDHPTLGSIPPAEFIPIAESTGLIVAIGEWVLEAACEQMLAWDRLGLPAMTVAVNVSPRQFELGSVATLVGHVLERTGLPADRLELELTESVDLQDPDAVSAALAELRHLGVHCAIDDFGTGYSCLSHLTNMPIAALKIDRAFTRAIGKHPDSSPHSLVVVTVIELARRLDLMVVAEGVETIGQLDFLRRHGCAQAQGYLFSRPVNALAFEALLRRGPPLDPVLDLRDRAAVAR
jgi:diguanylate cyclase (GGDEF)-like protein